MRRAFKIRDFISGSVWLLASYHRAKKRINGQRKRTWPFPLWRLHSDHSHRSADQCPETPPEHQELSVADALRTSVVTGNYLQINSPWPPARTRGVPLYSHRCCLGTWQKRSAQKVSPFQRMITATGCERSPSRQAKTIHSPSAVVVEPTSRSGTQSDWEKDRVCAVRGERGQCTFYVFSMAPKNRIFLPDCC